MQAWSGQDWLAGVGPRERAVATARSHLAAEVDTDVDVIMSTVSRDPWFVVPERLPDRLALEVREGTDEVRDYYAHRSDTYVVVGSAQLRSVATSWYVFNESAATLRQTAPIGGAGEAGNEFVVSSAILFPTAPDGIRGEIALTRHPFASVVAGQTGPPAGAVGAGAGAGAVGAGADQELANCRLLDDVVAALRARQVRDLLTPEHALGVRVDGPERRIRSTASTAATAAVAFESLVAGADDLTLASRVITDWYVFAEYLVRLDQGRRHRWVAAIHPVRGGQLEGTFGYGVEITEG